MALTRRGWTSARKMAASTWEERTHVLNGAGYARYDESTSAKLGEAADVIGRNPVTIQLRYLQTLLEIGSEQNSTIVFPLPIDLIGPLMQAVSGHSTTAGAPPAIGPDPAGNGDPVGNGHPAGSGVG